jgi:hypothetical protein
MTLTPGDGLEEIARQRTRDQYALLKEVHGDTIIVDSDDEADFGFICASDHVLLPAAGSAGEDEVSRLVRYFNEDRSGEFEPTTERQHPLQSRTGLSRRFLLPARTRDPAPDNKDLLATLDELDRDLGVGFARPDHLVHICGKGLICPATEPAETPATRPWPYLSEGDPGSAPAVNVVVIDTGWYDPTRDAAHPEPQLPWDWLSGVTGEPEPRGVHVPNTNELYAYAGHGTFVAGVVRAITPGVTVRVLSLLVDPDVPGGGVFEADLVDRLYDALDAMTWLPEEERPREGRVWPHLISMSAGCPTRLDLDLQSFEDWHRYVESQKADLVLVAAAGNNSTSVGFWPASFSWATGVGSLDRDGSLSDYSNRGSSLDVLAVGRDVVNAFPNGDYPCHETPDIGKVRNFVNWMSQWSGTSFSTPLVTGLIAAEMSRQPVRSATLARDTVLADATKFLQVGPRNVPVLAPQLLTAAPVPAPAGNI